MVKKAKNKGVANKPTVAGKSRELSKDQFKGSKSNNKSPINNSNNGRSNSHNKSAKLAMKRATPRKNNPQ